MVGSFSIPTLMCFYLLSWGDKNTSMLFVVCAWIFRRYAVNSCFVYKWCIDQQDIHCALTLIVAFVRKTVINLFLSDCHGITSVLYVTFSAAWEDFFTCNKFNLKHSNKVFIQFWKLRNIILWNIHTIIHVYNTVMKHNIKLQYKTEY